MKANNLTISLPYAKCGKNCPYCVSKMTGYMETHLSRFEDNLGKAILYAERLGITSVMITSKGEPLDISTRGYIPKIVEAAFPIPVEVQTNGFPLIRGEPMNELADVDVVAVSVDDPVYFTGPSTTRIWRNLEDKVVRATVLLSDRFAMYKLPSFISYCKRHGIRQLSFRKATIPYQVVDTTEADIAIGWIKRHGCDHQYQKIADEITKQVGLNDLIMSLPFGASVYDIDDISVTFFDYCIQEYSNGGNMRSLIYQEDGHMYTTWDKRGSIIW